MAVLEVCTLGRPSEQNDVIHFPVAGPQLSRVQSDLLPTAATTEQPETLSADILEVLGHAKGKLEVFGPRIIPSVL